MSSAGTGTALMDPQPSESHQSCPYFGKCMKIYYIFIKAILGIYKVLFHAAHT